jgi:hypothetical protein
MVELHAIGPSAAPSSEGEPAVYKAARAIGVLKPTFKPKPGAAFAEKLDVMGTGFWLRDHGVLVTCAHVVKNLVTAPIEVAGLLVVGNRSNYARATIAAVDFEHDLAVLRIPNIPGEELQRELATGLAVASTYPSVGAPVAYAGFPLGSQLLSSSHAPTYAQGFVGAHRSDVTRKQIQITGPVVGGFSGCPVVSLEHPDHAVGVLSSSPSPEAGNASIFLAISWEHVGALARLAAS